MEARRYSSWLLENLSLGEVVRLRLGDSSIGRHPSNVIRTESDYVSRNHARISVSADDQTVTIEDLQSVNGISVNERLYRGCTVTLRTGDKIGIGVVVDEHYNTSDPSNPVFLLKHLPLPRRNASNSAQTWQLSVLQKRQADDNDLNNPTAAPSRPINNQVSTEATKKSASVSVPSPSCIIISDDDDDDSNEQKKSELTTSDGQNGKTACLFGTTINTSSSRSIDVPTAREENIETSTSKAVIEIMDIRESEDPDTASCAKQTDKTSEYASAKPCNTENDKDTDCIQTISNVPAKEMEGEAPSGHIHAEAHIPNISEIKEEYVRTTSADIKNIFGTPDNVILDNLMTINPHVYNNLNNQLNDNCTNNTNKSTSGICIILSSDDESADVNTITSVGQNNNVTKTTVEQPTVKLENSLNSRSPILFDLSLNDSNDAKKLESSNEFENVDNALKSHIEGDAEGDAKFNNALISDDEELMFSQAVINDMKAELAHDNIDDFVDELDRMVDEMELGEMEPQPEKTVPMPIQIKTEVDTSSWMINDDNEDEDEYDSELENKVSDWSAKLFSQSLSQANMSQVYEDKSDEESYPNGADQQDDDYDSDCWLRDENGVDEFLDELYVSLKEKCAPSDSEEAVNAAPSTTNNQLASPEKGLTNFKVAPAESDSEGSDFNSPIIKPAMRRGPLKITDSSDEDSTEINFQNWRERKSIKKSLKVRVIDCMREEKRTESITSDDGASNGAVKIKERRKSTRSSDDATSDNTGGKSISSRRNSIKQKAMEVKSRYAELDDHVLNSTSTSKEKIKPLRGRPEIIEAPQLPAHRGKLRGVSACPSVDKKLNNIRERIRIENINNELKRKWLEVPNQSKTYEKKSKQMKDTRKERLKELANKQRIESDSSRKRRTSMTEESPEINHTKKPKVKCTINNRGAFLTEGTTTEKPAAKKAFKIPKKPNLTKDSTKEPSGVFLPSKNDSNHTPLASSKTEGTTSFEDTLSKCDLLQKTKPTSHKNHSSTEIQQEVKEITESKSKIEARAKRTTNKITFASMQRNFVESHENQMKLELISNKRTCMIDIPKRNENVERQKKTVRFDDNVTIHYIERKYGATKKVDKKDVWPTSRFNDRREMIRKMYPILDCTNKIISMFLSWSNGWLEKRNSDAHAALDVVQPMPTQFTSFENYKNVIFPLMKMEFLCVLEQGYKQCKMKPFTVNLEYSTELEDRFILITKYSALSNNCDTPRYDLVILNFNDRQSDVFAYVSECRKGSGLLSTLVFQILSKNYTKAYLSCIKEINVRPVIDNIRVEFGAFNAVFQLESTPLFNKILNPLDLLKDHYVYKGNKRYKGADGLNNKQGQILMSTYSKFIDEATPNITLIKGPPGTGKSYVIRNLALQALYGDEVRVMDKKILICAQSNAAVDLIAAKLQEIQHRMREQIRFRLIRYGMPDKIHPEVAPLTLKYLMKRDQMKKLSQINKNLVESRDNAKKEIHLLEMQIADMQIRNIKGSFEEDELIEKQKQLKTLRSFVNQSVRPEDERKIYTWYLRNANIVCTTLSSCVKLLQYIDYFDICIIDEATQCVEPWTLLPLKFGITSLVLVGDTQQLPATVLSKKAKDLGFGKSMFTRMQRCLDSVQASTSDIICSLNTQYRMHPEICKWPNLYFYKNELINDDITHGLKTMIKPFSIINLSYSQNKNCNNGKISNDLEAEFVVNLLKALNEYIPHGCNSYGIITPYAQHRSQLEASLKSSGFSDTMVNTIDSYQGIEKDVIIISNARTRGIGFLSNYQRLNVALTRPRKCLILCGNFKSLESVPVWRSLLSNAKERKIFYEISAENALDIQKNVVKKLKIEQ